MGLITRLGIAAAAGVAYSLYEAQAFTVRRVVAPVLPDGSPSLRILHLSDLHFTPAQTKKALWLQSLADLNPDAVVVTGDFIAHRDAVARLLPVLEPLLRLPGAFVFGSNDYYGPRAKNPARYLLSDDGTRIHGEELPWQDLRDGLTAAGWQDLTHRRAFSVVRGVAVEWRGVDDAHLGRDHYTLVAGTPEPRADVAIGVTHAPYLRVLDAMVGDGLQLILAGHTHGGQLRVPGVGALVTNCDLDLARARGLHRHGDAWLHVSAGCGTNPYTPVRFACRPEATIVELVGFGHSASVH